MSRESTEASPPAQPVEQAAAAGRWSIYAELTKARLSALVLITALVGYVMAPWGAFRPWTLLATMLGTAACALGANALNQVIERQKDAVMPRTKDRPLPAGQLSTQHATLVAAVLLAVGPLLLLIAVNLLTAALGVLAAAIYVLIYTPMKTRSTANTLVGAICGALPPMMGYAAAVGRLDAGAWVLGAILFIWQVPHFMALAWLYRTDYELGGFRMLPVVEPTGRATFALALLYTLALLPLGWACTLVGLTGWLFAMGSLVLGGWFLLRVVKMWREQSRTAARRAFLASVMYLPLLLGIMIIDRVPTADRGIAIVVHPADAPSASTFARGDTTTLNALTLLDDYHG
jgi:protoheme IX farnesyltransferase